MKIEVEKTEIHEVEADLPLYTKGEPYYYKVFSGNQCIQVCDGRNVSIDITHSSLAFSNREVDCTKEEFEEAYNKVMGILNKHAL